MTGRVMLAILLIGIGALGHYVISGLLDSKRTADHNKRVLHYEEITSLIGSADLKERLEARDQIEKLAPDARREALLEALDAIHAPTRLTSVTLLSKEFPTDPEVVEALLATAKGDLDADVKTAAFDALAVSGDPRALDVALEVLLSSEADLATKLSAARMLDRLTGRTEAQGLGEAVDSAVDATDDLGMTWDEWLTENRENLVWDAEKGRFTQR